MIKFLKQPIFTILLLTLFSLGILVFALSSTPLETFFYFFTGPFSNSFTFGNMINKSAPLLLTSLGAFVALRANTFNLGGEGQVYMGLTLTGIVPVIYPDISFISMLFIVIILTGLLALFSGFLLRRYNISELISTYLISMIVINTCNYLISQKFMAENSNILSTAKIPDNLIFNLLNNKSPINTGFIFALGIVILISIILNYTPWGIKFNISGRNHNFSSLSGINYWNYKLSGLFISGALHGTGGLILVSGINQRAIIDSYTGLGWNGLASGLIAGSNSIYVIFSSLFFSYLDSGANYASILSDTSIELSAIIKGAIFFIITSKLLKNHFIKRGAI